jgi:hypothetical protein
VVQNWNRSERGKTRLGRCNLVVLRVCDGLLLLKTGALMSVESEKLKTKGKLRGD